MCCVFGIMCIEINLNDIDFVFHLLFVFNIIIFIFIIIEMHQYYNTVILAIG